LIPSRDELLAYFQELLQEAQQGKNFMFHFVAHGNDSGIGFKHSGEFVSWSELTDIMTEINEASNNTLVLNLTSCFGLHGIKTVNPFDTGNPFFGLIGYAEKLKIKVGKEANKIFYGAVINEKLQVQLNDKNFHCITSQGYSHLKKLIIIKIDCANSHRLLYSNGVTPTCCLNNLVKWFGYFVMVLLHWNL
jgi:hypothetical protein